MKVLQLSTESARQQIPVFIGRHLLDELLLFILENFSEHRVFFITDSNVAFHHADLVMQKFKTFQGLRGMITFAAGEEHKNRTQKESLEDQLLDLRAGRDSLLVALGGGVVGDLAGFVAATLHRGVPYIQVPTSLLAQVDSSIGGKVGLNHPNGKNLIGAFYQPRAVFTDLRFLESLPRAEHLNGLAEILKYAVTLSAPLWDLLDENYWAILNQDLDILEDLVTRSIQLKIAVVEKDEKETSYRSILNFGHTIGHAIEKLSRYKVKHGFAVVAGMRVALQLSHQLLQYPLELIERYEATLQKLKLVTEPLEQFSIDEIWSALLSDKKSRKQAPRFTLLTKFGKPALFHPVSKEDLRRAMASV